ncbi:hypothetical protein G7Y89_g1490 [Cudoniella acicularis]|uniref:Carrier domain-containing protein n=1 Tax=Cudoniella acicularis TaxID=354080 RepID=A0A8H4RV73_9HELO|nr:hypothetical protein G7Y89_g1490 [Cudoniella acicularis]
MGDHRDRDSDYSEGDELSLAGLISSYAELQPHAVAATCGSRSLTYRQLQSKGSSLALALQLKGIGRGDRVVVLTTRCLEMVLLFYAILKVGACYVPLDVDSLSSSRISHVIGSVQAALVLSTKPYNLDDCSILSYDELEKTEREFQTDNLLPSNPFPRVQPEDLVYIIFTSGTTSSPKGVMIPHRALLYYVQQGKSKTPFNLGARPSDRVLLIFSPAFDACTGVIFSTLYNGATLVISDSERLELLLKDVTILPCTPSMLRSISHPERYDNLRSIFLGGEAPSTVLISSWFRPNRKIFNCYGPTESTITSLITELVPGSPITLGHPMTNSQVLLVNDLLECYDEGEIWISGPGLAVGYLNDDALTTSKFVHYEGTRFYRTGDYARRQGGELIFLGRGDSLIKNRGFLVNIETEIIPAICSQDKVHAAVAIHYDGKLIAFVTPSDCQAQEIRLGMLAEFDSFLVPDQIYCLDNFPLTPNGKINIRALQDKILKLVKFKSETVSHPLTNISILKSAIAWSLGLDTDSFSEDESFWTLGGNSLTAIQVLSRLRSYSLSISISDLLGHNTLRNLSTLLTPDTFSNSHTAFTETTPLSPITPIQEKLLSTLPSTPFQNYLIVEIELPVTLSSSQHKDFKRAWKMLFQHHNILSASFDMEKGTLQRNDSPQLDWKSIAIPKEKWFTQSQAQMNDIITSIKLAKSPEPKTLFRLLISEDHNSRLIWTIHHSRIDGFSMKVILEHLQAILDGQTLSEAPQFFEAAKLQRSLSDNSDLEHENFWKRVIERQLETKPLALPKTSEDPKIFDAKCEACIDSELSLTYVQGLCRTAEVSPSAIFYGAWALLMMGYTGASTACFGAVFSGRNIPMIGADRVVGPMINVCSFPVQALGGHESRATWLQNIQSQTNQISDMQWSASRFALESILGNGRPMYDTLVALQYDLEEPQWSCKSIPGQWHVKQTQISEFAWTLLVEKCDESFRYRLLYRPSAVNLSLTTRALSHFKTICKALLDFKEGTTPITVARDWWFNPSEVGVMVQKNQKPAALYSDHLRVKTAFELAVKKYGKLVALESISKQITYQELGDFATVLAWKLLPAVCPGKTVAILADGSLNWIISILAVIKTGAIYCPIDVNLPKERAERMISLSGSITLIVPTEELANLLQRPCGCDLVITERILKFSSSAIDPIPDSISLNDPVYLIFTSGTTGTPKGVLATNLGLLSYISYAPARLFAGPGRRIAQMFSVGFDACAAEIFGTLCYGGTLLLKHPSNIFTHLRTANAVMMTPSFLSTCHPEDFPNLDTIVLGGRDRRLATTWHSSSISDHMYCMSIIVMFATHSLSSKINIPHCMKMTLVHDIAEALVGDITPMDEVTKHEKTRREETTIDYLTKSLLGKVNGGITGKEINDIWREYEDGETLESKFVHDVDKIELVLQMVDYERVHEPKLGISLNLRRGAWFHQVLDLCTGVWAAEFGLQEAQEI